MCSVKRGVFKGAGAGAPFARPSRMHGNEHCLHGRHGRRKGGAAKKGEREWGRKGEERDMCPSLWPHHAHHAHHPRAESCLHRPNTRASPQGRPQVRVVAATYMPGWPQTHTTVSAAGGKASRCSFSWSIHPTSPPQPDQQQQHQRRHQTTDTEVSTAVKWGESVSEGQRWREHNDVGARCARAV